MKTCLYWPTSRTGTLICWLARLQWLPHGCLRRHLWRILFGLLLCSVNAAETNRVRIVTGTATTNQHINIQWMNDGVLYVTNRSTLDKERNKTNLTTFLTYYKTQITTNKVTPFYFPYKDEKVEIGFRDDGVVVWRKVK